MKPVVSAILVLSSVLSVTASAKEKEGGHVGNGGLGLACADGLRVLESRSLEKRNAKAYAELRALSPENLKNRLLGALAVDPEFAAQVSTRFERFDRAYPWAPAKQDARTYDESWDEAIPAGCALAQLAIYYGGEPHSTANTPKLADPFEIELLKFHESIYGYGFEVFEHTHSRLARELLMAALLEPKSQKRIRYWIDRFRNFKANRDAFFANHAGTPLGTYFFSRISMANPFLMREFQNDQPAAASEDWTRTYGKYVDRFCPKTLQFDYDGEDGTMMYAGFTRSDDRSSRVAVVRIRPEDERVAREQIETRERAAGTKIVDGFRRLKKLPLRDVPQFLRRDADPNEDFRFSFADTANGGFSVWALFPASRRDYSFDDRYFFEKKTQIYELPAKCEYVPSTQKTDLRDQIYLTSKAILEAFVARDQAAIDEIGMPKDLRDLREDLTLSNPMTNKSVRSLGQITVPDRWSGPQRHYQATKGKPPVTDIIDVFFP